MVSIDGAGRRTLVSPSAAHPTALGQRMHALIERLYPLCRSITGDGVRATLRCPHRIHSPHPARGSHRHSGLGLDSARGVERPRRLCRHPAGRRVIDFTKSNLHMVGYSVPVRTRMSLAAQREHLHRLPHQPDLVPYRSSYEPQLGNRGLSALDSCPSCPWPTLIRHFCKPMPAARCRRVACCHNEGADASRCTYPDTTWRGHRDDDCE